jgi:SHAQKYF class myb-like DNA-binding protein
MEPDDYDYDSTPPSDPAHPAKHMQFLDLTNGEGGDGGVYDGDDEEYPDQNDMTSTRRGTALSEAGTGGGGGSSLALNDSGGQRIDPSTPGRVVDTGSEHTGRWTKEEHEAFLSALQMYGKEWKKVAAKVKTRTVVQTRTHAQKYFQKLAKSMDGSGDDASIDMGLAPDSGGGGGGAGGKRSGSSQKKKSRPVLQPAQKVQRTASVANAAEVISNLSGYAASAPLEKSAAETSPTSSTTSAKAAHGFQIGMPSVVGFTAAASDLVTSTQDSILLRQPTHGFSSAPPSSAEIISTADFKSSLAASLGRISAAATSVANRSVDTSYGGFSSMGGGVSNSFPSLIKIVAPEPDSATKRGNFPEPSPAACGKRKLAEIAAARMLAGVLPPPTQPFPSNGPRSFGVTAANQDRQYHDNNLEDGTATPPPEEEKALETGAAKRMTEMSNIAVPHLAPAADSGGAMMAIAEPPVVAPPKKTFGLSLQIVNPESLGISHDQIEKRRKDGQGSPVTPWEGQLQALVR